HLLLRTLLLSIILTPPTPTSTLFPYTTLFRSKPYILSKIIVTDEAAPPPLKGDKSVSAELAAKGIDAEEAPKSLAQALPSRLMKDRKSTRLNSSHVSISYAVFCLKKKKRE